MAAKNKARHRSAESLDQVGYPSDSSALKSHTRDYRRLARQVALQYLHQLTVQKGANLDQLESFLTEFTDDHRARPLAREWIEGTWRNLDRIDHLIQKNSHHWDLNRISLVDRTNLRLAVYQLMFCLDIPPKVVINEAIELAKLFSTAQAPAFINGLLDVIRKEIAEQSS